MVSRCRPSPGSRRDLPTRPADGHDRQGNVSVAEPDVIVLALQRPVVVDRILDTGTEQPAADGTAVAAADRGTSRNIGHGEAVVVANPAAASLAIEQPVIDGPAES